MQYSLYCVPLCPVLYHHLLVLQVRRRSHVVLLVITPLRYVTCMSYTAKLSVNFLSYLGISQAPSRPAPSHNQSARLCHKRVIYPDCAEDADCHGRLRTGRPCGSAAPRPSRYLEGRGCPVPVHSADVRP